MPQHTLHPSQTAPAPSTVYQARLEDCLRRTAALQRRHRLLGYLRLLWVLAALALGWFAFGRHRLPWPVTLLPLFAFGLTARLHARVLAAAAGSQRAVTWYEDGLARIGDRWAGRRPRAVPPGAGESLFANDLDLFGPGSLFELLCSTRTNLGEDTLADWLLRPAAESEVRARQAAVRELCEGTLLRERTASAPGPASIRLNTEPLLQWSEAEMAAIPEIFRWLAPTLVVVTIAAALRWALGHSPLLFAAMLLINGSITFALSRRFKPLFEQTEQVARPLRLLSELLVLLEHAAFSAERLRSAQALLGAGSRAASVTIRQLARLAGAVEQRANFLSRLLDFGLLYSVHVALLLQIWRSDHGKEVRSWFRATGELEALLALSAYGFEHPADPFPELASDTVFQAQGLGHPLLPEVQCVRNDVALDSLTRLLVVSGSNMSGKSTLLRATGVACVMAMAGAPVRAHSLRLGGLRLGASIQVQDSLQGGRSRFYAEILRLRAVCELARTDGPVLFLLDELLAGTNSHDRFAGAVGVVESLLRTGAIGLLSTHDLALTQLGAEVQARVRNAHFEDRLEGDALLFDYTLRAGVITRSNGLDLMRLIGLTV